MIPIPEDFSLKDQNLDSNEIFARNILGIKMNNWAHFRHAVAEGNQSIHVVSTNDGQIPPEIKSMYCEIGPNHYSYLSSLAAAKQIFNDGDYRMNAKELTHHRLCTGFYHQLGSALDALARVVYILTVPDAHSKRGKWRFKRHHTDWKQCASLSQETLGGFHQIMKNKAIERVLCVRNQVTHGWMPIVRGNDSGEIQWPCEVTSRRDLPWPHDPDEACRFNREITAWVDWRDLFRQHYLDVEEVGEHIFAECVRQIPQFEKTHNLIIKCECLG